MGKSRPRKPTNSSPCQTYQYLDLSQSKEIITNSIPKSKVLQGNPSNRGKLKWVPRNQGAYKGNSKFVSKSEVGGSNYGEGVAGKAAEERENGGFAVVAGEERESGGCGVAAAEERESSGCALAGATVVEEREGGSSSGSGGDDVMRRLKELQVGDEEVELREEEKRINDQAQEDELLAMESIYGDNVYILDKWRGLRSFQIHIHVELPSDFTVSAKLNTISTPRSKDDDSDDFSYSFRVQFLSPIILTCLLPISYPSHRRPPFTITVQWLNETEISKLCSMLDSLWTDQPGQEIIYQWVEWLHASSLSYLGSGNGIALGPYGVRDVADRRAISESISPDVDIPSMNTYNEHRCHENFLSGCHECCICFSEYAGTEFMRLPCQHFFCAKCMKTYADMHIKEGTINKLLCPNTKCDGLIPPGLLKRLLCDEEFEHWESLMLQKTLESMSDVAYCPMCEMPCIEDDEHDAQCPKCFFSFCTLCREGRHVGTECMTPELKLRILQERQNSCQLKDDQRRKESEMINDILSVKEILRDAKQCPSCKMAISRTEGCNKMVCNSCGQYFCYRCNKAIDGYDHFRDGGCELFPQGMIQQWEERINARQVVGQIQAELFAERGRPCPSCGQLNVKVGNNNHMFCWACQNHYCYLCRKIVRRSSQHFGPKGCKQHTAD